MRRMLKVRWHQFREHGREHGLREAVSRALVRDEEAVPVVKELSTLKPLTRDLTHEGYRIVHVDGPDELDPSLGYSLRSRYERAQLFVRERGYQSILLVEGTRIIGDMWFAAPGHSRVDGVHPHARWFGFDMTDAAYMFDTHVETDRRSKGLSTLFWSTALHHMRERGFRRVYGYFDANNTPALWVHRLLGYEELPRFRVRRTLLVERAVSLDGPEVG
jgi:GNAT superfamily N-acetyltransferase